VGVPLPGDPDFGGPRCGYLKAERGTPARLKEHYLDSVASYPERDLARPFVVALLPISVHDHLASDAEPGPIVRGEIKGIEGITGHA
jgi:hypothetical protein